jgi:hypothetical protein
LTHIHPYLTWLTDIITSLSCTVSESTPPNLLSDCNPDDDDNNKYDDDDDGDDDNKYDDDDDDYVNVMKTYKRIRLS